MPTCWIIAGPNGAGKTTFALEYLPQVAQCSRFINADLIAAGLSPLAPERELMAASRLFLNEIEAAIARREDFAFETTLSGRSYLQLVRRLRQEGWRTELIYLALPSMEMSKLRVAERVAHGGHNIPAADIERRFARSLNHLLNVFSAEVDACRCFMNSSALPELVFEQQGDTRNIVHAQHHEHLLDEASS
jgi:predicted ABC-type ATPase